MIFLGLFGLIMEGINSWFGPRVGCPTSVGPFISDHNAHICEGVPVIYFSRLKRNLLRISSDPLCCLLKQYHINLAVFTQTVNSFDVVRIFGLLLRSSSIGAVFVSIFFCQSTCRPRQS